MEKEKREEKKKKEKEKEKEKENGDEQITDIEEINKELEKGHNQWASISFNCFYGCSHDCRYCYARQMSAKFKREKGPWNNPLPNNNNIAKKWKKRKGIIMFPTSHDITPTNMNICFESLEKMLAANNKILIVSKMHYEIAKELAQKFSKYKNNLEIRITIGSDKEADLKKWEPGAPTFGERIKCLELLSSSGFNLSVSAEPILSVDRVDALIEKVVPYANEIWLGKMNYIYRIRRMFPEMEKDCNWITGDQNNERILQLYKKYKDNSKIKWKNSILSVVKKSMKN